MLKTCGYLVSTISVLLLGLVTWRSASSDPVLLACLVGGMLASVLGMFLRWFSYRDERRQRQGAVTQLVNPPQRTSSRDGRAKSKERDADIVSAHRS